MYCYWLLKTKLKTAKRRRYRSDSPPSKQSKMKIITALLAIVSAAPLVEGFVGNTGHSAKWQHARFSTTADAAPSASSSTSVSATLPSPEESAQALQDYMVKAHEDKARAVREIEEKSRVRIKELEEEVATLKAKLESPTVGGEQNDEDKSYALPATNKSQTAKIAAYQSFVAKYVVESNQARVKAVKDAEDKLRATYEAKIAELTAPKTEEAVNGSD